MNVAEGFGVPDLGMLIDRPRVMAALSMYGTRGCVIVGSSGSGKTVAAAQSAGAGDDPVVWIDAGGSPLSAVRAIEEIHAVLAQGAATNVDCDAATFDVHQRLQLLSEVIRSRRSICVVIDDMSMPVDCLAWKLLARLLSHHSSRLLITTRCVDEWPQEFVGGLAVVESTDLNLTQAEAQKLLTLNGIQLGRTCLDEILAESSGHFAFYTVLARHVRDHGFDYLSDRSVSLDVWIRRVVQGQLTDEDRVVLALASLMRQGDDADLEALGATNPALVLRSVACHLPLIAVRRTAYGSWAFRVHDLVHSFFCDQDIYRSLLPCTCSQAITLLTNKGELARAAEMLRMYGDADASAVWLMNWGRALLSQGQFEALSLLIEATPVGTLIGYPKLLLLWSELCCETGRTEESLAKAKAARSLAEHEGDRTIACRSTAQILICLRRMNLVEQADALAAQVIDEGTPKYDELLVADALFSIGHNRMLSGDWSGAAEVLVRAEALAESNPCGARSAVTTRHARGLIPALGMGDFVASSRILAPLIEVKGQPVSFGVTVKGNVGICLTESGRLARAEALLRVMVADARCYGLGLYEGSYLPVLGFVLVGKGEVPQGIDLIRQGLAISIREGDQSGADQARVYLACVLRAAGYIDESLAVAERAYERLSVTDIMQFCRLAALEVAASLLALGDSGAARAWTESIAMEGFSGNLYHALRADLILAEIDRLDGQPSAAIARLAEHRDYILSENPNWQIAMYCRAFPALLGLVAAAVAPQPVPAHLLRMILPEHSEDCLGAARNLLGDAEWRGLGERLIGEAEFSAYLQRDGLPLCHVRLFGGLELSIGGRAVRERDWRKRKARLLFAMLAIRRGQDVPRDQLFEYLWPEMDAERAKNNLYVVWSTMKAALVGEADKGAPCPYIESVGGVCRTIREVVRTDVDEFETLVIAAREAEADGQQSIALRAYERIADLYRGDLLPGDVYDDWFATLRDHYRSSFVDAMLRATALLMSADDPNNALIYARRAIQSDPCREDLFQSALRCQIAAGQRSSAIDTYFQCRDNLAEELGLDPSVETRALYDQILAMEDRPTPTPLDPLI